MVTEQRKQGGTERRERNKKIRAGSYEKVNETREEYWLRKKGNRD